MKNDFSRDYKISLEKFINILFLFKEDYKNENLQIETNRGSSNATAYG